MGAKGSTVNWKEHPGKSNHSWGCSLQLNAAAATPTVATGPRRKETEATAAAAAAAGCTEYPTAMMARQSTRRRVEDLRATNDGFAIGDVIHILDKVPNWVGSAGPCNEEAPGERPINLQFSIERRSDEQTAEDSAVASSAELCCHRTTCNEDTAEGFTVSAGSTNFQLKGDSETVGIGLGTQALGEKDINNGSAEDSVEDNAFACALIENSECAAALMETQHLIQLADRSTLFGPCEAMGVGPDSQDAEDIMLFDSCDEKMTDLGSQCSDEKMREDGGSDLFGSEDMGDADSDILYLEGVPSLDEMEVDMCDAIDRVDAMCELDYSDEDTGEEDEGSEQHHGFDENTGEDDACEQPQSHRMEVDEAFLCPEDRERIPNLGLGTHVQYEKPSIVSWYDFTELPHDFRYNRFSNVMPIEVVHVDKSGGSDISTLSSALDDAVEVQFERGIVRHWACVDFSSFSYRKSLKLIEAVADMCVTIGMKFYRYPHMLARVKPATLDDIRKTLSDMRMKIFDRITQLKKEESAVFLLVILPHDRQYDERIKELCESLEVTYELCYPCYYKILKWPLWETACQIRSKVVKCDVRRRRLALPLVSEAPMIIFGADMFHCMPEGSSESIAAVAASLDWPKFRKYFIMESHQPYGEGIIKDLHNNDGGIMTDFFNSFYKRMEQNPKRIIFFRNGLEQGQFGHICQQEIDAIKRACAFFKDRCQPQLTYVVVLPTIEMIGMTDKSKDILPGTEAEPTKFKFWCCHRGQKNYCYSLVCYHVVHDDNNFSARELQSLTSKLCTFRHRLASPEIDLVPPAYYAQSAAGNAAQEWRRKTLPSDNKR